MNIICDVAKKCTNEAPEVNNMIQYLSKICTRSSDRSHEQTNGRPCLIYCFIHETLMCVWKSVDVHGKRCPLPSMVTKRISWTSADLNGYPGLRINTYGWMTMHPEYLVIAPCPLIVVMSDVIHILLDTQQAIHHLALGSSQLIQVNDEPTSS